MIIKIKIYITVIVKGVKNLVSLILSYSTYIVILLYWKKKQWKKLEKLLVLKHNVPYVHLLDLPF